MTRWLKTVKKGYLEKKKSGCVLTWCTPQLDLIVCTYSCKQSPSVGGPGPEWSSRTRIRTPPPGTEPAHPLVPPGYRSVWRTLKTRGRVLRLRVSSARSAFPSNVEKVSKFVFFLKNSKVFPGFISSLWAADRDMLRLNMCCRLNDLLEENQWLYCCGGMFSGSQSSDLRGSGANLHYLCLKSLD